MTGWEFMARRRDPAKSRYGAESMKFGELKSIGHNIADSLESGIGLLNGVHGTDIIGEASKSPEGYITVDFLSGMSEGGETSATLKKAIRECRSALASLCERHGTQLSAFKSLTARFSVDKVYGGYFTVTVEDHEGRRSVDHYKGMGGRKIRKALH